MAAEYPMATVRKDDLDVVVVACAKYLPDDPEDIGPDIRMALSRLDDARRELVEPEPASAVPGDGRWACIAFMGRNGYTGYVTEFTRHGQPAYRVDLPGLVYGGNPHDYVEYAASAWFSEWPVTEESVRKAWEAQLQRAAERARQEAGWQRMQAQRALEAGQDGGEGEDDGFGEAPF